MSSARVTVIASLLLFGVLGGLLYFNSKSRPGPASSQPELLVYCAAGMKRAVEPTVRDYETATGIRVQVQYAGSGTLLSNLKVAGQGDLYLAADSSYIEKARADGIVAEVITLARMQPVIGVARGNPLGVKTLDDLLRDDVRLVLPNPDAAAIGKVARTALQKPVDRWTPLAAHARAFKPTVNDLANDLKLGSADAVILWDATARQYPEIEIITSDFFADAASTVEIGVLNSCTQPAAALKFARFLGAPERGLKHFQDEGFTTVKGDKWAAVPELVFYSGGVNRVAIEQTLQQFEEREGVRINRIYNGCGILTAQIRAGQKPDGYFACDVSFMRTVADQFQPSQEMAETSMVIATAPGNPKGLRQLSDLAKPGVKIGVANAEQSALGSLTAKMLQRENLFEGVMANVVAQTPTADLLVNQLRTGSLDAVIVYEANTVAAGDQIQVTAIDLPGATAIQPVAINQATEFPQLMERLLDTLHSTTSQSRFTANGFRWRWKGRP